MLAFFKLIHMNIVTDNGEVLSALVTIVVGGIVRYFEKRKLRKDKKLFDKQEAE